jgi:hypothetical protein
MNDVTVRNGFAFVTNSFHDQLMVMDADEALAGNCVVTEYRLPDAFTPATNETWSANGVAAFANGLFVAHETNGTVWYINVDNVAEQQIIEDGEVPGADGVAVVDDSFLYVTQNTEDMIAVYSLAFDVLSVEATRLYNLTSDLFATPAVSAIKQGWIYTTNARFYQVEEIEEENPDDIQDNVIGIDCSPDCGVEAVAPVEAPTPSGTNAVSCTVVMAAAVLVLAAAIL